MTLIDFVGSDGTSIALRYSSVDTAMSMAVDNEHSEYSTATENGVEYHVFATTSEEYPSRVPWERDGRSFFLESTIALGELLEVAFSVKEK